MNDKAIYGSNATWFITSSQFRFKTKSNSSRLLDDKIQ